MKKTTIAVSLIALFAVSCGNSEKGEDTSNVSIPAEQPAATNETTATKPTGKIDPVCEMDYDSEWTEYTVYMNDTIHFCSENCKTAFLARPEKYMAAKQ